MTPSESHERRVDVGDRYPGGVVSVRVQWEDGAWWGQVVEVPGAFISGADDAEIDEAVREALELLAEPPG